MFVGGVVVEDEVEIEVLRRLPIDGPQEAQELVMAVALHALSDHRTGGDIQRGKQGGGPMPLVVVRHGASPALLHRQPRLGAIECLNQALLVDAQHQGFVRRVEVEADDILHLSTNCLSFDNLKPRVRCGFSPCAFQIRCTLVWPRPTARAIVRVLQCVAAAGFSRSVFSTTSAIFSAVKGGLRPGRVASHRNPSIPCARYRSCHRHTDGLLLPTARMIDIVPLPAADSSTMRDRHTNFCGVFRSATQPSSSTRSAGESQMHTSAFIPALSHNPGTVGIIC
jgi:hypothetical protein